MTLSFRKFKILDLAINILFIAAAIFIHSKNSQFDQNYGSYSDVLKLIVIVYAIFHSISLIIQNRIYKGLGSRFIKPFYSKSFFVCIVCVIILFGLAYWNPKVSEIDSRYDAVLGIFLFLGYSAIFILPVFLIFYIVMSIFEVLLFENNSVENRDLN
jgi:hypothetical protein